MVEATKLVQLPNFQDIFLGETGPPGTKRTGSHSSLLAQLSSAEDSDWVWIFTGRNVGFPIGQSVSSSLVQIESGSQHQVDTATTFHDISLCTGHHYLVQPHSILGPRCLDDLEGLLEATSTRGTATTPGNCWILLGWQIQHMNPAWSKTLAFSCSQSWRQLHPSCENASAQGASV